MADIIFRGNIFRNGKMIKGIFNITKNKLIEGKIEPSIEGTIIPAPLNFHTHIGDSFIDEEPRGSIPEIVGPGGFKMLKLEYADPSNMKYFISKTIEYMRKQGTIAFIDFRESGINGLKIIPKFRGIRGIFLTRPTNINEVDYLIRNSDGFGVSSISDYEYEWLKLINSKAKSSGKIFAIHFSENKREDINLLLTLKPDFIVHSIEASYEDLDKISKYGIPVVITPRSNIFYGKKPDYRRFIDSGIVVMIGTDNVFITEPNIWQEAEFLYRYQRTMNYISPDEIISMMTENPRKFIYSKGISLGKEKYVLYENEFLTSYQVVTKPSYFKRRVVTAEDKGINFIA